MELAHIYRRPLPAFRSKQIVWPATFRVLPKENKKCRGTKGERRCKRNEDQIRMLSLVFRLQPFVYCIRSKSFARFAVASRATKAFYRAQEVLHDRYAFVGSSLLSRLIVHRRSDLLLRQRDYRGKWKKSTYLVGEFRSPRLRMARFDVLGDLSLKPILRGPPSSLTQPYDPIPLPCFYRVRNYGSSSERKNVSTASV
jgi:hypothetical protein